MLLTKEDLTKAAMRLYDYCEYPAVRYKILFQLLDTPYDDEKLSELRPAFLSSDIVDELYQEQDMFGGYVVALILLPLSWYIDFVMGIVIAALIFGIATYFAVKVEKIKKRYNVQTYREIVAFTKGETLDEISKLRESGKRSYQLFFAITCSVILGLIISSVIWWILRG